MGTGKLLGEAEGNFRWTSILLGGGGGVTNNCSNFILHKPGQTHIWMSHWAQEQTSHTHLIFSDTYP